jgi:ABC-type transport system substrate-binding protein
VSQGFSVTVDCIGGETLGELTASILQSSWAKIGVHVNIDTMDFATLESNFSTGKYQVLLFPPEAGDNEVFDPAAANFSYLSGLQFASVVPSPHVKELIEKSFSETNEATRQKLAEEIQYDGYWKEPSWISIVNLASFNLASESLRGFSVMPSSHTRMEQIWLAH